MSPSTTVTTARDAASVGTVEPTICVRAIRTFASSPPRAGVNAFIATPAAYAPATETHGDPSPRVRRDEDASPGEGPKRERPELEAESRQQEPPVELADLTRSERREDSRTFDDRRRRRSPEALGPP